MTELWTVVGKEHGHIVPPVDDPDAGLRDDIGMVVFSRMDAEALARHQMETYEIDCEPMLLSEWIKMHERPAP